MHARNYAYLIWAELHICATLLNFVLMPGIFWPSKVTKAMAEGSIPYNNLPDKGSGLNNAGPPPPDGSGPSAPGNASDSSGMSWKTKVAIGATVGTVTGVGLAVAAPTIILPAIGFGAAGVAKASVAAGIQSVIVTVGKGSLFAAAQSAGAVGSISSMTGGIVTGIGTAGGAALGAAGSAVSWFRGKVSLASYCVT